MQVKIDEKKYGDKTVYKNFLLSVAEGKITCVLGESGSGKTTLLNCIAGLCGYVGEIPKVKCSYVFQTPRLVPNLTVYQNLFLVCKNQERICEILRELRIDDKKDAYPKTLSGGQSQRVALARALVYGGEIMLLDEPFSSLDLKLKLEISALFKKLQCEKNLTAIFVTHDVDEALDLGDEIVVLRGGEIILKQEKSALSREKLVSALIGV